MNEIADRHRNAMALAEEATLQRLKGNHAGAKQLLSEAYALEESAAAALEHKHELEPTRSILFRSAASLALECCEMRKAEQLVAKGLSGDPPDEIVDELRDLLEQIHFRRHLDLRGVSLAPEEFQMSLAGESVGLGVTRSDELQGRIVQVETTIYRTAERLSELPYRDAGRRKQSLIEDFALYVSQPRAASFAVTFRIGTPKRPRLPTLSMARDVLLELIDLFEMFNRRDLEALTARIGDKSYLRNFIALARSIAPDGKSIRTVGFTAWVEEKERTVALSEPRASALTPEAETLFKETGEPVTVEGSLRFADGRGAKHEIAVIGQKGAGTRIQVPEGMMADIVRPMWGYDVRVTGRRTPEGVVMEDIQKIEE